jgi:hypothetical protein
MKDEAMGRRIHKRRKADACEVEEEGADITLTAIALVLACFLDLYIRRRLVRAPASIGVFVRRGRSGARDWKEVSVPNYGLPPAIVSAGL